MWQIWHFQNCSQVFQLSPLCRDVDGFRVCCVRVESCTLLDGQGGTEWIMGKHVGQKPNRSDGVDARELATVQLLSSDDFFFFSPVLLWNNYPEMQRHQCSKQRLQPRHFPLRCGSVGLACDTMAQNSKFWPPSRCVPSAISLAGWDMKFTFTHAAKT